MKRKKVIIIGMPLVAILLCASILLYINHNGENKSSVTNVTLAVSEQVPVVQESIPEDSIKPSENSIKSTKYKTNGPWIKVCDGIVKASPVNDGFILHTVCYGKINTGSIDCYRLNISGEDGSISQVKNIQSSIRYRRVADRDTTLLSAGGYVFSTFDDKSFGLPDGRLVLCDFYRNINLWAFDDKGNEAPFFTDGEIAKLRSYLGIEDDDSNLVRFAKAGITQDGRVVFLCYDEGSVKNNGISVWCLCSFDIGTRSMELLYKDVNYKKDAFNFGAGTDNTYIYFSNSKALFTYNFASGKSKTITYDILSAGLSPDGRYLLYRESINAYVQNDLMVYDIQNDKKIRIPMVDGYFYNTDGAWSPDSSKYAFYINGRDSGADPKTGYRTNIKLGIIDINAQKIIVYEKPDGETLNALGSISFAGDRYVIANTLGNQTFAYDLEYDMDKPYEIEQIFDRSIIAQDITDDGKGKTADYGNVLETWYPRPHDSQDRSMDIVYIDEKNGWKLQRVDLPAEMNDYAWELYRTYDGGRNWEKISSYSTERKDFGSDGSLPKGILPTYKVDGYDKTGISFLDENNGFMTGGCHNEGKAPEPWIYVTNDGGYTWKKQILMIPPMTKIVEGAYARLNPPDFFTPQYGMMSMGADMGDWKYWFLYFTHDGGRTWDDVQDAGIYTGQMMGKSGPIEWDFTNSGYSKITVGDSIWIYGNSGSGGYKRVK